MAMLFSMKKKNVIMATKLAARIVLFRVAIVVWEILGVLRVVRRMLSVVMVLLIRVRNVIIRINLDAQLVVRSMQGTNVIQLWVPLRSVGSVGMGLLSQGSSVITKIKLAVQSGAK